MTIYLVMFGCILASQEFPAEKWSDKVHPTIIRIALAVIMPIVLIGVFYRKPLNIPEFWLITFLIILGTQSAVQVLVGDIGIAVIINTGIYCLLMLANTLAEVFRGTPFHPSDFLSLSTAWSVRGQYMRSFHITYEFVISILLFCTVTYCICKNHKAFVSRTKEKIYYKIVRRIICFVISFLAFVTISNSYLEKYNFFTYHIDYCIENYGYIVQFMMECKNLHMEKPLDYDKQKAEEFLAEEKMNERENGPDIIVVMDESLTDFDLLGDLPTNKDYLPFIHSLPDEMKGKCYVSVWGGNTCTTEWEMLTGNSLAFCQGTIPFNQFINSDKYSFARYLKNLGYDTVAIHPWYPAGWKRDVNYPMLGIEKFYSIVDFDSSYADMSYNERKNIEDNEDGFYVRDLISDKACFDKVISVYEEHCKKTDNPLFLFNVTIQNHGDYCYSNYESPISLTENMNDEMSLEQYLGVAYESDNAIKGLLEYYETVERDVVILIFGDHHPKVEKTLYDYLNNSDEQKESVYQLEKQYIVPFILWTNMEDKVNTYEELSANYLSLMVAEYAGLPLDQWQGFLKEVYAEFPIINAKGLKNNNGEWIAIDENVIHRFSVLTSYNQLQYYRMFDEKIK